MKKKIIKKNKKKTISQKDESKTFDNILAVVKYLTEAGWRVKKSAAYKHHHDGLLRPEKDGKYKQSAVDKYAAQQLKRLDGKKKDPLEKILEEKSKIDRDKSRVELELLQRKNDLQAGMYVPRESLNQELAKRARRFRSALENNARLRVEKIIAVVSGDPTKAPLLQEFLLDDVEEMLAVYDSDEEFVIPMPETVAAAMKDGDEN